MQFDHELDDPPKLVAWSLTDFLAGRMAEVPEPTPQEVDGELPSTVRLGDYVEKTALPPPRPRPPSS